MPTEADTCRTLITPKLQAAGWENDPHSNTEQRFFTDGRIVVRENRAERRPGKRADYILRYTRDFPIAVVGAKAEGEPAAKGLQQAKNYAETLGLWLNILDYTSTATRNFADPIFDGDPAVAAQEGINEYGKTKNVEIETPEEPESTQENEDNEGKIRESGVTIVDGPLGPPLRKYYFDGGAVEIAANMVYELDAEGKQLRVVKLTDYTREKVRSICRNSIKLRACWSDPEQRAQIIEQLHDRGINFPTLIVQASKPDADPFDLLCHLAFDGPMVTRRQRADRVKKQETAFFKFFAPEAREILNDLLEKYAADGELQFTLPDLLKVPPISGQGNVAEIIGKFGDADQLRNAVNQLQSLLYAG